jgi:hypothetical protein
MHVFWLSVGFQISLPGKDQVEDCPIQLLNMHIPVQVSGLGPIRLLKARSRIGSSEQLLHMYSCLSAGSQIKPPDEN